MKKTITQINKIFCTIVLFLISNFIVHSQSSISKPTFGFSSICADPVTPVVGVNFKVNYSLFPASSFIGSTFNLLISDANGVFPATPNVVATSNSPLSTPGSINFAVPSTFVGGNNYKFKVQCLSPAALSPESNGVIAYYRVFTDRFSINNEQPTLTICGNTSATLSIDFPESEPASIPYLKYIWTRNADVIPNESGKSITVTTAGKYFVYIDYGTSLCSSANSGRAQSQEVTVNIATGGDNTIITSNTGNIITETAPATLSTENNASFFYQWYKDDVRIDGQTTSQLITSSPGIYFLEIYSGLCTSRSNKIELFVKSVSLATLIPNIVSPNGDGINDFWEIPEIYNSGVTPNKANVVIHNSNGKKVYETDNYINKWPESGFDFDGVNPIFYYIITPAEGDVKKGTITIIK